MTPADHSKAIGILHLVYGGFSILMMFGMCALFLGVFGFMATGQPGGEAPPMFIVTIVMVFMFLFYIVLAVPSLLAGYGLLKQRKWAKVMAIVAAVVAAMSVPFGTALCVYTLWFLFGDKGRALYDNPAHALPPPPPLWVRASSRQPEPEHVRPSSPPDWR